MPQQNIEVVKRGYEAFSKGDVEAVMSQFDDNLEWVQPGESAISGIYRGKAEFGQYLGRLAEKALAVRPLNFLADGDTVVAFAEVTVGSDMCEDADVYTLRDGKIVRAQIYTDTAMMERVFGRK
ncbi:nuclear transport factor 2 family protein [Mycobacterium sp. Y57]|uniref:nuclear transport factor 2 family protein n=1 Tax=Mycolicibacterium xanthum TaxID=2796469 RepID=UPI001C851649|nr:nuclear transport factor 2 family protein [Mycolicibacterium xanthum]MBX7431879.1 nuclear transport factor 2 family protein [Mycolicibacterium xanthum]